MKPEQLFQMLNIDSDQTITSSSSTNIPPTSSIIITPQSSTTTSNMTQPQIHDPNQNPFQWSTNFVPFYQHYQPANNLPNQSNIYMHAGFPPPPPPPTFFGSATPINQWIMPSPPPTQSSSLLSFQQSTFVPTFNQYNENYYSDYPPLIMNKSNHESQQFSNYSINNNYNNLNDPIQHPQQLPQQQQAIRSTTNESNNKCLDQNRFLKKIGVKQNRTKIDVNDLFKMATPNDYLNQNNKQQLTNPVLLPTPSNKNHHHHQYYNDTNTFGGDTGGRQLNDDNENKNRRNKLMNNNLDERSKCKTNNEKHHHQQQQHEELKRLKINRLDDKHLENILAKFAHDLLETEYRIEHIIALYAQRTCTYLYSIIWIYFEHLELRLNMFDDSDSDDLSFTELLDGRQYSYTDFCSYGQRFVDFLEYTNWFKSEELEHLHNLIARYERLHPKDIIEFRRHLLDLKLQRRNNRSVKLKYMIDYRSVTYERFDQRMLYTKVITLKTFREKFNEFDSTYSLSEKSRGHLMTFVKMFERMLYAHFEQFQPHVHTFGSISNGLGTSNSDFDLFIQFENIHVDKLDFYTSMMALEVIEKLMKIEFGLQLRSDHSTIIHSRRCPIIKLNFRQCLRHLQSKIPIQQQAKTEFTKCDISLVSMYGVHNSRLLNFFTRYDRRFYELTMALKYWAKTNELISQNMFSTYAFTMLIVFFLQQQKPPILPTVIDLNRLAKKTKKSNQQFIHNWDFDFCDDIESIEKSRNRSSTTSLFVEFFRFYNDFNFFLNAIRPRHGVYINKFKLAEEKERDHYFTFNMTSFFCIEDPFVLDHNVAYNFRTRNVHRFFVCLKKVADRINERNCMDVLLEKPLTFDMNPDLFPSCNLYRYELVLDEHNDIFELRQRQKPLLTSDDIDRMWQYMMKFFLHIIQQLLTNYFFMPTSTVHLSRDNQTLSCHPHWPTLNKVIHSKRWPQLSQLVQSKTPGSIDMLRCFRNRFRKELDERDLDKVNTNNDIDDNEEWFNLSYSYRPNDSNFFANFNVNAQRSSTFAVLDVVIATLQIFLHAIDRADPIDTFGQCYRTFLLKSDDD